MATAKKLPSGNWRVQVSLGTDPQTGKRIIQSVTACSKKEAEYEALQLQLRYKAAKAGTESMTLREAMEKYIESRSGVLSITTKVNYESILRNYFQTLMNTKLSRLTPQVIQTAISYEAKQHSPKTVRNAYGLLTATIGEYNRGLYRDLQNHPPRLPQREKFHPTVLTVEQVAKLLIYVRGNVMEIPIICALWLCMRESEICGLTWDCVDWENSRIHVKQARVLTGTRNSTQKTTKTTESDRWIDLHPYVLGLLHSEREKSTSEYVTTLSGRSMWKRFKTILKHAGLPDMRFHDLRHSNASIMALVGVPLFLAQMRGGWSTPTTMQRTYTHPMSAQNDGDRMVNDFFEKLLGLSDSV